MKKRINLKIDVDVEVGYKVHPVLGYNTREPEFYIQEFIDKVVIGHQDPLKFMDGHSELTNLKYYVNGLLRSELHPERDWDKFRLELLGLREQIHKQSGLI